MGKVVRKWLTPTSEYTLHSSIIVDYESFSVTLTDCSRTVSLDFGESYGTSKEKKASIQRGIKKLDKILGPLQDFRDYLAEVE